MLDLTKLTPAPWEGVQCWTGSFALAHGLDVLGMFRREDDCDFAALARKAFDVMMRRGVDWLILTRLADGAIAAECLSTTGFIPGRWADPFSAWVEADLWYATNIERKSS